jgi:LuxR family transcriptional regulator, regulator of acetate metabolism
MHTSAGQVVADSFVERRRRLRAALGRLAKAPSSESVRACAPRELAMACGFTRVMLSAVRGSRWVPLNIYTRAELHHESKEFLAFLASDADIPLANLLIETDIVRRRAAILVDENLISTRAFQPIVELAQSPAYVAAPILVEGRAVGFVHADRVGQELPVDEDDRRYVQAFSGELAVVYQRAIWKERLSERVRRALDELEQAKEVLELIENGSVHDSIAMDGPSVAADTNAVAREEHAALTAREWEVLSHVVEGATNMVIAQRLSLSEHTVKTHMHSILRKLRVATRGAAVARYLEISKGPG